MTRQQTLYGKIPKKKIEYTIDVEKPNQIRVPPKICIVLICIYRLINGPETRNGYEQERPQGDIG